MPVRPREMNDQLSEARIRTIIQSIVDQEIRRLSIAPPSGGGKTSLVVTSSSVVTAQVWSITITNQPIYVTLWEREGFLSASRFDTSHFFSSGFGGSNEVKQVVLGDSIKYNDSLDLLQIDWGESKSGTFHILNFDSGAAFGLVAVAD